MQHYILYKNRQGLDWTTTPYCKSIRESWFIVNTLHNYITPGTHSLSIVCNSLQEVSTFQEDHKLYRSCIGVLLYLENYSRSDIANTEANWFLPEAVKEIILVL